MCLILCLGTASVSYTHLDVYKRQVSDTVVTAYEKISSLKKEESFRSWIFTILSNHCKNQFRKRAQTHELDETYPSKESDYAVSQDVKLSLIHI